MPNTSASGGYLVPTSSTPLPGGLTLVQFIQSILVALSGINGTLVRPSWQIAPPKQPDITENWIAFGVTVTQADTNAYSGLDDANNDVFQRQELIEILCSFYGPLANDYAALVRDGFQIQQNSEAMRAAKMGYRDCSPIRQAPELVNERWQGRTVMNVILTREINRTYPVLSVDGSVGIIKSVIGGAPYSLPYETPEEEE